MKYQSFTAENITDFDPQQIFLCGQCFRWTEEEDGSFTGAAMGKIANIRYRKKEKGRVFYLGIGNERYCPMRGPRV